MPFVIEKTKDPLYKEGLYEGEKKGEERGEMRRKLEDAIIMVEKFKIDIKDVSRELKVPIEEIKKRLK
jgi:predicted transposase YdaD